MSKLAHSNQSTMDEIDARRLMKSGECPKCGLEAKSLLHRHCQDTDCPVRKAISTLEAAKQPSSSDKVENIIQRLLAHASKASTPTPSVSAGVMEAAKNLVAKIDELAPHINNLTSFYVIHGGRWTHGDWVKEILAVREALSAAERAEQGEKE